MNRESNILMSYGAKKETFETLLREMESAGYIPDETSQRDDWAGRYEDWTVMLQKVYEEALQKEKLEEAFAFNRKMGSLIKEIALFACAQSAAHLFFMGTFIGVFRAMFGMLPKRNKEQIFNIKMAKLKERAYVKPVLELLYENDYMQHRMLCGKLTISASQLNRIMKELVDVGCVRRYECGKFAFYSLTLAGKKYVHEVMGCGKEEYNEYASFMLAGQKPQMGKYEKEFLMPGPAAEYRISDHNAGAMLKYGKFANVEYWN